MTLNEIQRIFNRAAALTFSTKKLLFVSLVLIACGLFVVFFQGLGAHSGQWVGQSLIFIPIFLCAGVLLSTGILLIRIYHDEVKEREFKYSEILARSWEVIIGASYLAIPIVLSYLLLWMMLGFFVLLREIPIIGEFFMSIFAFAPFLLNLGSLLLCLLSILMLYFITPVVALKGFNRFQLAQVLTTRLQSDLFSNIVLGILALLPILFFVGILTTAALLTGSICLSCERPIYYLVQWFFIMVPYAVILSPAVIFFFNFAAESHVLLMKELNLQKDA